MSVSPVVSQGLATGAISTTTFAAGAINAAAIAPDAIGASELATDAVTEIVGAVVNSNVASTVAAVLGDPKGSLADLLFNLGAQKVSKGITFDGAATYGAFTVSGTVAVKVVGAITMPLTITPATTPSTSVGTATSSAGLIALTLASAMDEAGKIWVDATPSKLVLFPVYDTVVSESILVTSDTDILTGALTLQCWWFPVVPGSTLTFYQAA